MGFGYFGPIGSCEMIVRCRRNRLHLWDKPDGHRLASKGTRDKDNSLKYDIGALRH